ncbi:CHC2 zinc finger domain-containing protein [Rhodococcus antarcticus]|uniref:CHC2 zinc finger domain-containing protein n=1 Tax=Rhodococcus antarcticus TaxID=2987751 RepID=A0ABY6NWG9_9NOCA|nr:CHC2 zinc finger domain-containing protein [Rhodococcus antarcticus]UZJ23740.1 CHC2 zinc finger domain-containing protein [Rhodococcus antarcticus]
MSEEERPDLGALLDHYDVQRTDRAVQMVQCPLHEDRTPSCSVHLEKGLWNCKSCGEGGDPYTLIELKEETNFVGARTIAATLGLATGVDGGGGVELSGSAYASRRRVSARKGSGPRDGGYVPAWKRGRS